MSSCKRCRLRSVLAAPLQRMAESKLSLAVYIVCHALIGATVVRGIVSGSTRMVTVPALAVLLMLIPTALKLLLRIKLPVALETMAYLFIFSAMILGEVYHFYSKLPAWDLILHVLNGFMFAALGFCLIDLLRKSRCALSPLLIALTAFCFSVTVGVFWEFIEFGGDTLLGKDMQKDMLLHDSHTIRISSLLEETAPDSLVHSLNDIQRMELYDSTDNLIAIADGYLDIGLTDTVKDMVMNCVGAAVFCGLGYYGLKTSKHTRFASFFIPTRQLACGGERESDPNKENSTEPSAPTH